MKAAERPSQRSERLERLYARIGVPYQRPINYETPPVIGCGSFADLFHCFRTMAARGNLYRPEIQLLPRAGVLVDWWQALNPQTAIPLHDLVAASVQTGRDGGAGLRRNTPPLLEQRGEFAHDIRF